MFVRCFSLAVSMLAVLPALAAAQSTFTPVYHAPNRAFEQHEFGGSFSFPDGARDFAIEGAYRFGVDRFDIGLRAGLSDNEHSNDFLIGIDARMRVLDHESDDFPLDGAIVAGIGTADFDVWTVPTAGISLGRRVDIDDFSFVPYVQPALFLYAGNGEADLKFGLGLGADFRVAKLLDLRVSIGLFDGPEGLALSLVWVR
ncbi:MAG TPA: hypothetical protein VJR89_09005 [Polyangiales bacterium]|nr:hypothetical protein [Polyangiales bacterium]